MGSRGGGWSSDPLSVSLRAGSAEVAEGCSLVTGARFWVARLVAYEVLPLVVETGGEVLLRLLLVVAAEVDLAAALSAELASSWLSFFSRSVVSCLSRWSWTSMERKARSWFQVGEGRPWYLWRILPLVTRSRPSITLSAAMSSDSSGKTR